MTTMIKILWIFLLSNIFVCWSFRNRYNHGLIGRSKFALSSTEDSKPKRSKRRRKIEVIRDVDGLPVNQLDVRRPSKYKPIYSGGSKAKKVRSQGVAREREIANPNRLRIIGGTAKGKKIDSPDVYLRPMMAKVREAIFSQFQSLGVFDSNTTRVLDAFAGSGSVGLEALSRGACHTTFVDLSQDCISTALTNAKKCGFEGQVSAVCASVEDVLTKPESFGLLEPYGLISLTPPYEEIIYKNLIDAACNSPLIVEDTILMIEYPIEIGTLPPILGDNQLFGIRNRRYGRTILASYVYRPSKILDMRPDEFVKM